MTTNELMESCRIDREREAKKKRDILDDEEEAKAYMNLERCDLINLINQVMVRNIIDDMLDEGYIPKHYNGCYGGWGMSDRAKILWVLIDREFKGNHIFKVYGKREKLFRKHFILAKVILFLGEKSKGKYSKPVFDFVKIEFYDFVKKEEYDGLESLDFLKTDYISSTVKSILKNPDISNDEKIDKLNFVVDSNVSWPILDYEIIKERKIKDLPPIFSIN